jgi:hypothetical protein
MRRSADEGRSFREIVRQQWNFSPPNTIREVEEFQVALSAVAFLNGSLCLTSVEERFAPRSRVCACLDRPLPAAKLVVRTDDQAKVSLWFNGKWAASIN